MMRRGARARRGRGPSAALKVRVGVAVPSALMVADWTGVGRLSRRVSQPPPPDVDVAATSPHWRSRPAPLSLPGDVSRRDSAKSPPRVRVPHKMIEVAAAVAASASHPDFANAIAISYRPIKLKQSGNVGNDDAVRNEANARRARATYVPPMRVCGLGCP